MFPPMSLVMQVLLNLTILVYYLLIHHPHAVLVHPNIVPHAILEVDLINLAIKPVYFSFLISIIIWLWAVILKPSKLGRVEKGAYGDCVGGVILVAQRTHVLTKLINCVDNDFPACVSDKVIVTCDNEQVHGFGVVRIFNFKCVENSL